MFGTLDDTRKNDLSSSWKQLFLKCLLLLTSQVPKKWSYHLHNKCQNRLWTFKKCSLTFVMFEKASENRPKSFHQWKDCLLFKKFCFQQPPRSYKNALISSTVLARKACGSLWIVAAWCSWHWMSRRKMGQNLSSSWKQLFHEMFLSIDLLGPKEMILSVAQKKQNSLWTLINCSLTFVTFEKAKENGPKFFHHWKDCLFFQKFVFSTNSQIQKNAFISSAITVTIAFGPL